MDTKKQVPSILMLPWLAHGHVSPFLELAKKLSKRNFHIYLCSTAINLKPFKENLPQNFNSSIQLIEIHLPSSQDLPPHFHTTKNLPPHLMPALKTAMDEAKTAFSGLLESLKPDLVIYDFLQPWVPIVAREENIEAVLFLTCGAACCSFLIHCIRNPDTEFPFQEFNIPKVEREKITQFMHETSNGLTNAERFFGCIERSSNIVLIKTSIEIEADYVAYLSILAGKEMIPVGPLVQNPSNDKDDDPKDELIMDWLNKKEASSTVFVSFGSEYFLSKQEIEEIAHGLELSKVSFIWVVRFHGGERNASVHKVLPQGFLERVKERGMVVEGWAPQGKILGHPSIGGFVSHCGWSSTLEGVVLGVPFIAMPMHLDQPLNAKLVVESGVGIEVRRENGRFEREGVARVIKQVVEEVDGEGVRRKVKELSERIRGKSVGELDLVVEKLMELVRKS
ncbi:flavanone 7-O-glucoside 2''-O-beta-L-rhamnosyltransferase-like [Actinidia eriantha]|uniref:flavanone 7-O-glucoside 2''-O-beta-L-rhamnosyltransferase-like n=1 Tax=Actinidia eriantha TaxID=165200 RepID=UPI00258D21DC|nr:flavanone 7-O-glucoside 2''-O-beta-L-rhamnosyltransferase-like [Actinidia eriantha]